MQAQDACWKKKLKEFVKLLDHTGTKSTKSQLVEAEKTKTCPKASREIQCQTLKIKYIQNYLAYPTSQKPASMVTYWIHLMQKLSMGKPKHRVF